MVFNIRYGFLRWSVFFALCFWRLRLKTIRVSAWSIIQKGYALFLQIKITPLTTIALHSVDDN